jgi:hypothetical protein
LNLCEQITRQLTNLFSCEQRGFGTLLRTPLVRPDGDLVEVVLKDEPTGVLITDLGESVRWLDTVGGTLPNNARVETLLAAHGATFIDGEILVRVLPGEELALAVLRSAQACLDFSSSIYSARAKSERNFEHDVKHRMTELRVPFRDESLLGMSGMRYRVTQAGDVHRRFRLVNCLSSRQKPYAQQLAKLTRCMWEDLRDLKVHDTGYAGYVSVLDDGAPGLWGPPEIKLLERVSTVVFWSQGGSFEQAIGAVG